MRNNPIPKAAILASLIMLITISSVAQRTRSSQRAVIARDPSVLWKSFAVCGDSVNVDLPGEPVEFVEKTDVGESSPVRIRENSVRVGNNIYAVDCFEGLPFDAEDLSPSVRQAFFEMFMRAYTSDITATADKMGFPVKSSMLPVRESTIDGKSAFEQDFRIGPLKGSARMMLYGRRGILCMILADDPVRRGKTSFFGSVKVHAVRPISTQPAATSWDGL